MRATKKTIQIEVEYYHKKELVNVFDSIIKQVSAGKSNHFENLNSENIYTWCINFDITNDFREEEIDGVWCRIYKSRLNE